MFLRIRPISSTLQLDAALPTADEAVRWRSAHQHVEVEAAALLMLTAMDEPLRHPHAASPARYVRRSAQSAPPLATETGILPSPAPVINAAAAVPPASSSSIWPYLSGVLSGTASGVTKMVVGHPFETIKVRMQTEGGHGRFSGSLDCLRQTLRNEGPRALYKGATPPLVGWGLIDSLMWGSLIQYRRILQSWQADPSQPLSLPAHFVAGGAAGLTSVILVTPIEQVKVSSREHRPVPTTHPLASLLLTAALSVSLCLRFALLLCQARLQIQYHDPTSIRYRGPIDCIRQLVRNNGVRGLYIGMSGTIAFRWQMSWYFGGYELVRRRLAAARPDWSDTSVSFVSGGLGSNLLWCVAFPADTVKNRMMAQRDTVPRRYPTLWSCCRDIMQTEGIKGFYRGFVPCILRSFPTNGAAFVAAETMLKILPQ